MSVACLRISDSSLPAGIEFICTLIVFVALLAWLFTLGYMAVRRVSRDDTTIIGHRLYQYGPGPFWDCLN